MARKSLASLVDEQLASGASPAPSTSEVPESQTNAVRKSELTSSGSTGVAKSQPRPAPPAPVGLPKYLRLVRKEARLTEEQVQTLTALSRRLNRRRGRGEGERITENTLIRVGVELLLRSAEQLEGTTEEELLDSVSPALPD
jgi:hypothetical protein